jgi:FMN-dependent oxidoreductase (nitrilotriacetate monooxygenase family)
MKLLAFLMQTGGHIAGWRHPRAADNALCNIDYFRSLGRTAERGLFDGVFFADYLGYHPVKGASVFAGLETPKLDPIAVLATIAADTRNLGLIGTASTSYSHPYDLARRFASLDHLSRGRAGWNIVTSTMENEAHNYGLEAHLGHAERYARADEFVAVVRKLWDSWQDGAVVADKVGGRYTDPSRISAVDHAGEHFRVAGPLTVPRPPQGHPVLVQAGASATGQRFAGANAEVIFTSHPTIETAKAFRAAMHAQLPTFGRLPTSLKIMPAVTPVIGRSRQEAQDLKRQLDELIPAEVALSKLEALLGNIDLSRVDPDGGLPDLPEAALAGENSTRDRVLELAKRERLPVRELARQVAAGRTGYTIVGTPEDVADALGTWEAEGAADGFIISAPFLPGGLEDFVDMVVPLLQERGQFRREYEGVTLRENLGLAVPENIFDASPELRAHPEIW